MRTSEHRVFTCNTYKHDAVVNSTRRLRFGVDRHVSVSTRKTILRWVRSFRTRKTVLDTRLPDPRRTVSTPENIERVILRSPSRFARRRATELGFNDRTTVRRILHEDLELRS